VILVFLTAKRFNYGIILSICLLSDLCVWKVLFDEIVLISYLILGDLMATGFSIII
jgi:hypothetical protein